jgi:hypothetical protein
VIAMLYELMWFWIGWGWAMFNVWLFHKNAARTRRRLAANESQKILGVAEQLRTQIGFQARKEDS